MKKVSESIILKWIWIWIDYFLNHHLPRKIWSIYLELKFRYWNYAFERKYYQKRVMQNL